ncbi:MAG TPA: S-layer protein domain-containing protein [Candidatus Methylomirabilis sp.]|nr:S-layer protein domain-containing protein [Candidatus Methylomirabilis sp.]
MKEKNSKQLKKQILYLIVLALYAILLFSQSGYAAQVSPIGTNQKVLVICVKYDDISTTRMASCNDWANLLNSETNTYYNQATFSLTSFAFETSSSGPANGWYDLGYPFAKNYSLFKTGQDAISLIDPNIDFSNYNRVFVITNYPGFDGQGVGPWWWKTDEGIETNFMENGMTVGKRLMTLSVISEWQARGYGSTFDEAASVGAHELGHQLGVRTHYADIRWNPGLSRDTITPWDIMGLSPALNHFIGWAKADMKWIIPGARIQTVGPPVSSDINTTVTLYPQEVYTTQVQLIRIPFTRNGPFLGYVVENRKKINGDGNLPNEGVLVSLVDENSDIDIPSVIVMTNPAFPGDLNKAPLRVGDNFSDPARNIRITVLSQSGNNYNTRIQYPFPPSGRADPMITPWGAPPWETPDIWVDSQKNGWDVYRYKDVSDNPVSNGDNVWVNHDNRVYVKIHNSGTAAASNVKVLVYVNSPPGIGDRGANWDYLGTIIFPFLPAGGTAKDYVMWRPTLGAQTCIKAIIEAYPGELNGLNNNGRENADHFDTAGSSPYPPVAEKITVNNPFKDNETPVHLNVKDVPAGWGILIEPADMILPAGGNASVMFQVFPSGIPGAAQTLMNESEASLTLKSNYSITLKNDAAIELAGKMIFRVPNYTVVDVAETPNSLMFYPAVGRINGAESQLVSTNNFRVTSWDAGNFPAFLYDRINDRLAERLYIDPGAFSNNDTIARGYLLYQTGGAPQKYKIYEQKGIKVPGGLDEDLTRPFLQEGGYYTRIGWFGEDYVAINGKNNKLSGLVLEQNMTESKNMKMGETWDMGDGYTLTVQSIDIQTSPETVGLSLSKNGVKIDEKVLSEGEVYTYVQDMLANENNVPVFVTYVDGIFTDAESGNFVQLKYSWLISDSVIQVKKGDRFGIFEVGERQSPGFIGKPKIEALVPYADTYMPIGGVEPWTHLVHPSELDCKVVQEGSNIPVIISGQLTPPIANATIAMEFILNGMHEIRFTKTDANGNYILRYNPHASGHWNGQAFYSGDDTQAAAECSPFKFKADAGRASIKGKKVNDINGNGKVDPGENGIRGWTIILTASDGSMLSTLTDSNGSYTFTGLKADKYVIGEIIKSSEWMPTIPEGGNYTVDISDGDQITGKNFLNHNLMLWLKGDLNNNGIPADAGDVVLMKRASIGEINADFKYDLNNNGLFADAGDIVLMKRASIGEISL